MRKFAEAYPDLEFVQAVPAQISWTHHVTILDKVSEANRMWYVLKSAEQGWSYRVLMHQIDLQVHTVFGALPNNFAQLLPPLDSDLAHQIFKDEYIFDFIAQEENRKETELEKEFVQNITQFLLTLGKGFAFVGKQYHIEVGGQDFYIDLLFYHFKLKRFVVLELKIDDFKSEYAGKLNFYLSVVDDLVKQTDDKPTIGLLLCKTKNDTIIEYALRDVSKPMGVTSYQLTKQIPDELKDSLPTLQELQQIANKMK